MFWKLLWLPYSDKRMRRTIRMAPAVAFVETRRFRRRRPSAKNALASNLHLRHLSGTNQPYVGFALVALPTLSPVHPIQSLMDKPLSQDQPADGLWMELISRATAFAGRCAELSAQRDADNVVATDFPRTEFDWLTEAGLLAAPLPRRLGGSGLNGVGGGTWPLLQVLKQVGWGSLPVGRIYEGHVNALALVELFGTEQQQAHAATDVHAAGRIFGVWNAEEEAAGVTLRLRDLSNGRYRFEGGKVFCSGLGHVTRPIVGARWEGGGWQMCLLPMEQIAARMDHRWWQPIGMEATVSGVLDLTGIELSADSLLGPPDVYYQEPWFNGGAIRFVAVHLGGAQALYDAARAYLQNSHRTDHPIQRLRAAEMAMRIESGDLWLRGGAAIFERQPVVPQEVAAYVGMARLSVEAIAQDIIRTSERMVGARGLMRPYPFARLIRDLTMYLRQPAPDAVMDRVGRHVLDHGSPAHHHWPKNPAERAAFTPNGSSSL